MLQDARGRPLRDLRVSVTDRFNFRCVYCMPREVFGPQYRFLANRDLLTFEEIARLARVFARLGVEKIRLTGGEPLLRRDLEILVAMLAEIPGLDLAMTTNGALLQRKATALVQAGLRRITVSLDSLDETVFQAMNDADFTVARVLAGIDAAAAAGLAPIKINAVIKRGVNENSILDLAGHFRGSGHVLRFIEFMDVGATNGWALRDVVPSAEVIRRIHERWPVEPMPPQYPGEVAHRWRYQDGGGEVGVVSSVTQAFCRSCNRARLSPEGGLFTCLFATEGQDLRALLRGGADDDAIAEKLQAVWQRRDDHYSEIRTAATPGLRKVEMSYIGG